MELHLIRHGEAVSNVGSAIAAPSDPLTLSGARQARALGQRLAAEVRNPRKLVTSPLIRARQTAEIVAECLGLSSVEVIDNLAEMSVGSWASRPWEEFLRAHPHLDPLNGAALGMNWGYPDGETLIQVRERGHRALQELARLAETGDQPVIAVSHGTLLTQALSAFLGVPASPYTQFSWSNAAIATLILADGLPPKLARLNDTAHLAGLEEG
jgi:broad specificity phosphatase PhoE